MTNYEFTSPSSGRGFPLSTRDLLAIGFRRKRILLTCLVGMVVGTVAAMVLLPAKYEAQARILVKRERVDPVVSAEKNSPVMVREEVTEEELNSEVELIESDDVLRQAVTTCGLDRKKELFALDFWPFALSPEKRIAEAVSDMRGKLKVEPIKKTNMIRIAYTSSNGQLAARVLNVLANAYLEKHLAVQRAPGQLQFFEQETERYQKNLNDAEEQLKKFADERGGVAPQLARDITLQKLNEFSAELEKIRADMAGTEQRIRDLQTQANSTPGRLTTAIRESDDAAVLQQLKSTLMSLELKRTELLTKFQPGYRLVQEVEKEIADTRTAITAEESKPLREQTTDQNPTYSWISTELAKAKSDYSALQARAAATEATVQMYQTNAHELEEKGLIQQDLLRTAKANEDNYLLYLHKREEARMSDALDQTRILNVALADQPAVPVIPINSPWMLGLVGALLAVTVSIGAAVTTEYLDTSFRTPAEVSAELNIPVLAAIPYDKTNGANHHNGNGNARNGNGHNGNGRSEKPGYPTPGDQQDVSSPVPR